MLSAREATRESSRGSSTRGQIQVRESLVAYLEGERESSQRLPRLRRERRMREREKEKEEEKELWSGRSGEILNGEEWNKVCVYIRELVYEWIFASRTPRATIFSRAAAACTALSNYISLCFFSACSARFFTQREQFREINDRRVMARVVFLRVVSPAAHCCART